ncbi:MAG: TetR/AcrR family transcriptional regulator [Mycobacterium sp.]
MARTQQQRREDTIARLLDASIETIVEVGYAKASAKVISQRAQVSDGALFRHFPTMSDFMAATAYEVMRRQLEVFAKRVAEIPADKPALEAVLAILREITSNPTNTVMYELMVAARTDEKLRVTLQDVLTVYSEKIYDAARTLPSADELEAFGEQNFVALVAVLINTFDGAAIVRHVLEQPEIEEQRIPLLTSLLTAARPKGFEPPTF